MFPLIATLIVLAFAAMIPAGVAFLFAHLSRHHTTRKGARRRVARLLVGAAAWVALGVVATRAGDDNSCGGAEDCMFQGSFDPLIWAVTLAPAVVWTGYALATIATLASSHHDFLE